MIHPASLLALAALMTTQKQTPPFDETVANSGGAPLVVLCDPVKFRFSVRAAADANTLDSHYPRRTVIALDTLVQLLPGLSGAGEIRGPLIRYVRCGPFTIKLTGDAYNASIQGESGAYPVFATLSLIVGNRQVVGPVRLTECDRTLSRARGCPDGYAVRIDGSYDAARRQLHLVQTTSSTAEDDPATRRISTDRTATDLDLAAWPAAYDD